jgi:hypothetical protein
MLLIVQIKTFLILVMIFKRFLVQNKIELNQGKEYFQGKIVSIRIVSIFKKERVPTIFLINQQLLDKMEKCQLLDISIRIPRITIHLIYLFSIIPIRVQLQGIQQLDQIEIKVFLLISINMEE